MNHNHKSWEELKLTERQERVRRNMPTYSPYTSRRTTRKFLGLKVVGGILAFIIYLLLYLAVIAAFVFFLVWGSIKIVKSQVDDDTPPTTPITEHPVILTHGGSV